MHKDYAKASDDKTKELTKDFIAETKTYFKPAEVKKDDEGNPIEEAGAAIGNIPDIMSDSKVWANAGISFGEYETMLLVKSLKGLVAKSGATFLRLWGKIKCTEVDYFIAEGKLDAAEEGEGGGEKPEGFEARGSGINQFVYWACNGALGKWT